MTIKKVTTLGKLSAGSLFICETTLCLKTEYRTEKGATEAFIVGSGEFFSGGGHSPEKREQLEVLQVELAYFN